MKQKLLAVLMIATLVVIFAVGTVFSPLALFFRPGPTFRAMNRLCGAAWLGFEGKNTISKECGLRLKAGEDCTFCKRLCSLLNLGDPNHCEKEAAE